MPKTDQSNAKSPQLQVPDAPFFDQFKANAKEAWLEAHPQERKRPGRPSDLGVVFESIWAADGKGLLGTAPTQGKLYTLVRDHLGEKAPSEKAIRKYAKLWLLHRRSKTEWSEAEISWYAKHAAMTWELEHRYSELLFQNPDGPVRSYPGGEKEMKFTISGPHFKEAFQIFQLLNSEYTRVDPPQEGNKTPDRELFMGDLEKYVPELFGRRRPR